MIATAQQIHRARVAGKRPAGMVYLSLLGALRCDGLCVVINDAEQASNLDLDCLAGLDVAIVTTFPISHRALDVVDACIRGGALNIHAIDPIGQHRISIVNNGEKFFSVQPFDLE